MELGTGLGLHDGTGAGVPGTGEELGLRAAAAWGRRRGLGTGTGVVGTGPELRAWGVGRGPGGQRWGWGQGWGSWGRGWGCTLL